VNTGTSKHNSSVKVIGANGQISLGKEYAGRQVIVEQREPGVWLVRTAVVIPDNELWLHHPEASEDLKQALAWARQNSPQASDPDETLKSLESDKNQKRKPRSAGSK
jgi:hypothetical protein